MGICALKNGTITSGFALGDYYAIPQVYEIAHIPDPPPIRLITKFNCIIDIRIYYSPPVNQI